MAIYRYKILSIIFLKEFIELNVNTGTVIKTVKLAELNKKIRTIFWNTEILAMI